MKKFIFAILVMVSSITFVQEDAFACTGGTCNDAAWQQQQQQQQGTSIATDNRNYATNSPTAVMSANNNVYTGNMNYMMDGVSCPSTQLYAGVGAGTTYFNPGGANSQNYQVNGGIAIPLDSQTCEQVMALKEKMYTRLDTEAALRMCMALKNDGLQMLVFDADFNKDYPGTERCQSIFTWMQRNPEAFSHMPDTLLKAKVENLEKVVGQQFKK